MSTEKKVLSKIITSYFRLGQISLSGVGARQVSDLLCNPILPFRQQSRTSYEVQVLAQWNICHGRLVP
jgi:hypothetical protein